MEKIKKIRFIQVKSSYKPTQNPSDVSEFYNRELKKENKKEYRLNNSWIDKLLTKAELFKEKDGYKTQFQLYTSYHIVKTSRYNFDFYTDNNAYSKSVPKGDALLKIVSESSYYKKDKEFKEYNYEERCGEKLKNFCQGFICILDRVLVN
ncbi:hypothetical protein ACT7DA_11240 [Bacillus pacificus]